MGAAHEGLRNMEGFLSEDLEVCHGTNVEAVGIALLVTFGIEPLTLNC